MKGKGLNVAFAIHQLTLLLLTVTRHGTEVMVIYDYWLKTSVFLFPLAILELLFKKKLKEF